MKLPTHIRVGQGQLMGAVLSLLILLARVSSAWAQNPPSMEGPPGSPSIKVDVDLVVLHVTVSEQSGRPFSGLKAEDFRVYDNGVEQTIRHFSTEDLPFSMGMVLDRSGSMTFVIDEVYQAAFHTIRASKPEDEFFIFTFNDQVDLRQDFSMDREQLQKRLKGVRASGRTALYDAVLTALNHIQRASHNKKALLVVTDGDDNNSEHSFRELLENVRQQEKVAIYVVGFFSASWGDQPFTRDSLQARLTQLAEATGGKAYFPRTMEECDRVCIAIAEELRQQYSLGYYPQPKLSDGSWRSVQVQLQLPADLSAKGLMARSRTGYFAPRN